MYRIYLGIVLLCTIYTITFSELADTINKDVTISEVKRTVDLTTQLPKIVSSVTIANTGSKELPSFVYTIEPSLSEKLAFIGAVVSLGKSENLAYLAGLGLPWLGLILYCIAIEYS